MTADHVDIIEIFGQFDPVWYAQKYPDVAELGEDPLSHFKTLGCRLGRGLSADCPTTDQFPTLAKALSRRPTVSYCIPVMDRLADLQATLADNLQANAAFSDEVEFLVLCFEEDHAISDWIRAEFPDQLRTGYLRVIEQPRLPIWHFGQAKSAFHGKLSGRFYSSLDADNFVTAAETLQLLGLCNDLGEAFMVHHFSGDWGDGSSGRVTLPAALYEQVRYDRRFLPRQFDEVDLILSALKVAPDLWLFGYETEETVFQAISVRDYLRTQRRVPAFRRLPRPHRRAPINPNAAQYAATDPSLAAMQSFNEALSFLKNAPDAPRRSEWVGRLRKAAAQWVERADPQDLQRIVFGNSEIPDMPNADVVCLLPNGQNTVRPGRPRLVVDARADPWPQGRTEQGHFVLHPQVGDALVADLLWRGSLARIFTSRTAPADPAGALS